MTASPIVAIDSPAICWSIFCRMLRFRVRLLAALIALGGCATKAQQEVSRIQGIAAANAPVVDACWARAVASPPHQALKGKMGDNSDALTLAMKTNAEKATPEEAAQMLSLQWNYLAPCRKIALESAGKVHPAIVAILTESYAKAEATLRTSSPTRSAGENS